MLVSLPGDPAETLGSASQLTAYTKTLNLGPRNGRDRERERERLFYGDSIVNVIGARIR